MPPGRVETLPFPSCSKPFAGSPGTPYRHCSSHPSGSASCRSDRNRGSGSSLAARLSPPVTRPIVAPVKNATMSHHHETTRLSSPRHRGVLGVQQLPPRRIRGGLGGIRHRSQPRRGQSRGLHGYSRKTRQDQCRLPPIRSSTPGPHDRPAPAPRPRPSDAAVSPRRQRSPRWLSTAQCGRQSPRRAP